jgi:tetratricopeptide (TPR) repeat protein
LNKEVSTRQCDFRGEIAQQELTICRKDGICDPLEENINRGAPEMKAGARRARALSGCRRPTSSRRGDGQRYCFLGMIDPAAYFLGNPCNRTCERQTSPIHLPAEGSEGVHLGKIGLLSMTVSPLAAAIALHQRNPLEEVARAYHDILADDPWQADARPILLQQGKIAAAQNQFETALRALPDYALARNNLGNCWPVLGDAPGPSSFFAMPWRWIPPRPALRRSWPALWKNRKTSPKDAARGRGED